MEAGYLICGQDEIVSLNCLTAMVICMDFDKNVIIIQTLSVALAVVDTGHSDLLQYLLIHPRTPGGGTSTFQEQISEPFCTPQGVLE